MTTLKHSLQLLGMYGVGISLLLGWLLAKLMPRHAEHSIRPASFTLTYAAFVFSAFCSAAYLIYPNFIDHLEPTVLQITQIWSMDGNLYPPIETPSMHGLLYGPALYWFQLPFLAFSNDLILGSKLPGVLAFNVAWILLFALYKEPLSKAYLVLLLPFNLILFWNRAEPFFILIVALAIWVCKNPSRYTAISLGVLAGLASSCKAHGVLYVLPLLFFFIPISIRTVLGFFFAFAVVVLSFFLDARTSLIGYIDYLKLATQHGISFAYLEKNLFFLVCTWLPLALTFKRFPISKLTVLKWGGLVVVEVLVSIAGAKPGAGVHHLIPVVVLNSYLYETQLQKTDNHASSTLPIQLGLMVLSTYVLVFAWKNVYDSEIHDWPTVKSQTEAKLEIRIFTERYPHLFMGITDKENAQYRLTFFRPLLVTPEAPQFEYAGFMDLNYAGVSGLFLSKALNECQATYIALPNGGAPFSILNFYNNEPLFPEAVRSAFRQQYRALETGKFFTIYGCK